MWKSIKMLEILYRAGSSSDNFLSYEEFSKDFSEMKISIEEIKDKRQRETLTEYFERVRKSQFPVASQFFPNFSLGNCWAVTANELYNNFLLILRNNEYISQKDLENAIISINYTNKTIIAMQYREELIKKKKIILEIQKNEPHELLSVMMGDLVMIVTDTKKELLEKLELYEKSMVLKTTSRYFELLKSLEYSIEVITPNSYPETESGHKYLNDNLLQSLFSDYGGNWLIMFSVIENLSRSNFYLSFYDFYYRFTSEPESAQLMIYLMKDNVIGFAALNDDHVVAVLKQDDRWNIIDTLFFDKEDFVSTDLSLIFDELKKRKLNTFHIVFYQINNTIVNEKKNDSPRKRIRDERLSREELLLKKIESDTSSL